jgi:heme-degrading monooxygenase HmoA
MAIGAQFERLRNGRPEPNVLVDPTRENIMAKINLESLKKAKIARIWQGCTTNAKADDYERYLYEAGIKKIAETEGNLGVQVMRHSKNGITEFITISYWANREDIKPYAGEDIERPHHLQKDAEYLLELPESVKNCDLVTNDWK